VARVHSGPPKEQSRTDQDLDAALAATFPASDPVSMTQPGGGDPETASGHIASQHGDPAGLESPSSLPR
jgi:hypothetical protein